MVLNVVPLADEAFLVALAHVWIELVAAEEALAAELAQRVHAAVDLFRRRWLPTAPAEWHRREMGGEEMRRVERVLMREDFLVPDA